MSLLSQKTIKNTLIFKGIGLHTGADVKIKIKPAQPNTGIIFKRVDLDKNNQDFFKNLGNEKIAKRFLGFLLRSRQRGCNEVVVRVVGPRHLQARLHFHGAFNGPLGAFVSGPTPPRNAVVDVPVQHGTQAAFAVFTSVDEHAKSTVHHLTPSDAAAIVQADPCRAAETVTNEVLDRHVRGECRAIVDVGGLAVWAVRAAHVVVVPAEHDRSFEAAVLDGVVEG